MSIAVGGALSLYAIRTLPVASYGQYAVALTLLTLFGLLSEFGIATVIVRRMIQDASGRSRALGIALVAEISTSAVAALLVVPAGLALGYEQAIISMLALGTLVLLTEGLLAGIQTPFPAMRALNYAAVVAVLQGVVTAAVGIFLLSRGGGPSVLIIALISGNVVAIPAAVLLSIKRMGLKPRFVGIRREILPTLRPAVPIALTGGFAVVYERVDLLMVSKLDSTSAAALYSVALTVLTLSQVLPGVLTTSFFPVLSDALRDAPERASDAYLRLFRVFIFVSLPPVLFLAVGAHRIVPLIFGDRYEGAATPVAVIGASVVLGFLNYLLWVALLAAHREGAKVWIMLAALVFNVGLNVLLIPSHGPSGAAVALVVSDVVVVAVQLVLVRRHVFAAMSMVWLIGWPVVAAALGIGAGVLVGGMSWIAGSLAAAAVSGGALIASGYARRAEWAALTSRTEVASN